MCDVDGGVAGGFAIYLSGWLDGTRRLETRVCGIEWDGMGWGSLSYSGGLKNAAGMFAKMDVWLPGEQWAFVGFVNTVTGVFFELGEFGSKVDIWEREESRTCAGEVAGVVAAGCMGVAGVD